MADQLSELAVLRAKVNKLQAVVDAVVHVLERHGCDCDCGCHPDEHGEECVPCYGCEISQAMKKAEETETP